MLKLNTLLIFGILVTGCSSNLSRFNVLSLAPRTAGPGTLQVTRYEIADQGSGEALLGGGGHILSRITVGGSYGRRINTTSGTHLLSSGLHANPRATY